MHINCSKEYINFKQKEYEKKEINKSQMNEYQGI